MSCASPDTQQVYLAIVGSRTFQDYELLKTRVLSFMAEKCITKSTTTIVSGGATGADTLAERFATEHNLNLLVFPADWKKYPRAAGPIRNTLIVNASDYLIAFPSRLGKGTQDSIQKAKKKGIPVGEYFID